MTTITQKIISKVYEVDESKFDIQMMYMPMNTPVFRNDLFAEVVSALASFTIYAFVIIANKIIATTSDFNNEVKI